MRAKPTNITSWSFSRYSVYRQCPQKAKYLYIDKLPEPQDPTGPLARGAAIHTLAENFIKGKIARLPKELEKFKDEFNALKKQYKKAINGMVVEDSWAFTKSWSETAWNDWINCWVRIKIDCAHHLDPETLMVSDWKTGKYRQELTEEYQEQLELYALSALLLHPHIKEVHCRLVYLDTGDVHPQAGPLVWCRDDIEYLQALWTKRVTPMLKDKKFAPKANDKCRWCHFSKAKGGPCRF
jgi:hypothetical protein